MTAARGRSRPPCRGAVLLVLLLALSLLALGQLMVLEAATTARQREREQQLQFSGEQFRRALLSYARVTPAGAPIHPATLEELLLDRRLARPQAHLRQLWPDPFTGRADWQLIQANGRIVGLHSRASVPVFMPPPGWQHGDRPPQARDWRFVVTVAAPITPRRD